MQLTPAHRWFEQCGSTYMRLFFQQKLFVFSFYRSLTKCEKFVFYESFYYVESKELVSVLILSKLLLLLILGWVVYQFLFVFKVERAAHEFSTLGMGVSTHSPRVVQDIWCLCNNRNHLTFIQCVLSFKVQQCTSYLFGSILIKTLWFIIEFDISIF